MFIFLLEFVHNSVINNNAAKIQKLFDFDTQT